jgi:hypothetical protein
MDYKKKNSNFVRWGQNGGESKSEYKKTLYPQWIQGFRLAAGEGFEPSQTESESVVLPLHNPAISIYLMQTQELLYYIICHCQDIEL